MLRIAALLCLLAGTFALRDSAEWFSRSRRAPRGGRAPRPSFKTRTDSNTGVCAAHVKKGDLPIDFPLLCTGNVRNLKFRANARGHRWPRLRLSIDGQSKGYKTFPAGHATRTWIVSHGSLSAGLHTIYYSGDRLSFNWLEVEGTGGSCSFSKAPGYSANAFTYSGLDVITRVVGPPRSFPAHQKQALHFAHETRGKNTDGSISASVVSNGVWEWMYKYSQEQNDDDEWLSRKVRDGDMYAEADIKPYLSVALKQLGPRFSRSKNMTVCEPCNTVSNIMFMEATVYTTCKAISLSEDEWATLLSGLSGMGAGSTFFHASATRVGQLADVFGMELVMYQVHQLLVKGVLAQTRAGMSRAETNSILYLDSSAGLASQVARRLTTVFGTPYDRVKWEAEVRSLGMPGYELSIIGTVLTFYEAMRNQWPIPGVRVAFGWIIKALLSAIGGDDVKWVKKAFWPALRKAFGGVKYCGSKKKLVGHFIKFTLTFVDAFIFQEEKISPGEAIRDLARLLGKLGFSGILAGKEETWDCYNGQRSMCLRRSAHAAWHEKSAHGLMHIEEVASLLSMGVKRSCHR